MSPLQFYRDQAVRSHAEADAATLDNVRVRCTRAAIAWEEMAERISRTDAMRAEREAVTAARTEL
ncbi:hypothetical protein D3Y57_13020 [Sphingomonas paeninsulae]|uniref:Uncharacterized protein n=1 Tax=Sphingomonas paeninsulae TaxID=2319844 RepID=A0A494THC3_SPHPE|nr:hypothetical protein [Sphingomonas paeninsulae]AYJ86712.1 hypothetical protein D3Y57_13020 [Sphingomonas paeninsulae]